MQHLSLEIGHDLFQLFAAFWTCLLYTSKIITKAKQNDLLSKRQVYSYVTKETVAKKVFDDIAPKYAERNGGYCRIIKIGPRRGDAAEMAIIELI